MSVGPRYDLEAVRAKARAEKRRARVKALVSNVVLGVVLLCLAAGGKVGWDFWQEKRARDRRAAEEADRLAALEAREAESKRQAEARIREAETKLREEALEAERKAREEERLQAIEDRKREAREREEARQSAEAFVAEQKTRREYVERTVSRVRFAIDDHLVTEFAYEESVGLSVDGRRWEELSAAARVDPLEFLWQLKTPGMTNDFSQAAYPDAATVSALLRQLDTEKFVLVVQLRPERLRGRRLELVAPDRDDGLVLPKGARSIKDAAGRTTGWTVPFAYGDRVPMFVLSQLTRDKLVREWTAFKKKVQRDAEKLTADTRRGFVERRLEDELPAFVRSVSVELRQPPPAAPVPADKPAARKEGPKLKFKGVNSDIRTLSGPRPR